jgi:polyisoprenoid-binding protein YceI
MIAMIKPKLYKQMKRQFLTLLTLVSISFSCTDHDVNTTTYALDETASIAEWKGYLRTGFFNEGSIAVESQNLTVREGKVHSGSFTIPLASIVNFNQPTEELRHALVHHLQSPDFFNMALHPNLEFNITGVTPYSGSGDGIIDGANFLVSGNLTMLGKPVSISFPAKIDISGNLFRAEGTLKVDRTQWGINFATDPALPDEQAIKNDISIRLNLTGHKI